MANFVLVHGAWHGGWCWRDVVAPLARAGHRVFAPTLTGVGERAHLLSRQITLETHIADVMGVIEAEELSQVVLAVHSYAGMIGTAVADRMGERLAHLVYVDAVVPRPGESWSSTHASATRVARLAAARANPTFSFPPPDPAVFGLAAEAHAWVARRQTPHPGGTYEAPLATIDVIRQRVRDPRFWDGHWARGAHLVELATGHDPMISAPGALVDVLLGCSG